MSLTAADADPTHPHADPPDRWTLDPSVFYVSAAALIVASLVVGWFITFRLDMGHYVDWQLATAGWRPWNAYTVPLNNYPPVVIYLLTVMEAVRGAFHVDPQSRLNFLLVKIPNLLAQLIGGYVLMRALTPRVGVRRATLIGVAWIASLSLFVNVIWGQWDVVVSLFLLLAMLAALRGAWFGFGFWLGIALATKFQIVFAMPVAAVYLIARTGWRGTLLATAGGLCGLALAFAPMAIGGRLHEATAIYYTGSVDTWPKRSMFAWNIWEIANGVEVKLLHRPMTTVLLDDRPALPGLTYRRLGLLMFATYLIALLVVVARRPTLRTLILGVPLAGVAMFMLATQMHDRYIAPPAALMTIWLLLGRPFRIQFVYWTIAAGLNQFMSIAKHEFGPLGLTAYTLSGALFSSTNIVMFVWLTWLYFRKPDHTNEPVEGALALK